MLPFLRGDIRTKTVRAESGVLCFTICFYAVSVLLKGTLFKAINLYTKHIENEKPFMK
jgi:hypothetical protein